MAVAIARSTDVGAPVLSGTVGSFIGVLDYLLVTVGGWSKVYSGTNLAVYRAPAGNRHYFRVDDTNATVCRIRGYETMSDVNTGTGPFPTDAQFSGGLYLVKSTAASAADRAWVGIVTDRQFYFWRDASINTPTNASAGANAHMIHFGDFKSYKSGDAYNTLLVGCTTGTATTGEVMGLASGINTSVAGHYASRSHTQLGSSMAIGKQGDFLLANNSPIGQSALITFPNPADGGVYMSEMRLTEPNTLRGTLPGIWAPTWSPSQMTLFDVFTGTGVLAGRTFEFFVLDANSSVVIETSNTWNL